MGEGETEKMAVEEVEVEVEEVGGRGEKARTQQPLLRASQPALSPKVQSLLDGAERKTQTVSHPAAPTIDKDQSDEGMD